MPGKTSKEILISRRSPNKEFLFKLLHSHVPPSGQTSLSELGEGLRVHVMVREMFGGPNNVSVSSYMTMIAHRKEPSFSAPCYSRSDSMGMVSKGVFWMANVLVN